MRRIRVSTQFQDRNDTRDINIDAAVAPAAGQNGSSDSDDDNAPPRRQASEEDLFRVFAEKVRDCKELESRWAVIQETRVEYFRGKDFVKFLTEHPELKEVLDLDKSLEAEDIVNVLLGKNLLLRCNRVVQTVRPGKKKLSTWPAHLEIFPDQVFSETNAFFAWTFVKRCPLWQTMLSFVCLLGFCLFPLFPHRCKLLVLYTCFGLFFLVYGLLSCLLSLRCLIFSVVWLILGKHVWFFPNIFVEKAPPSEESKFWPTDDEEGTPIWPWRFFYAILVVVVIFSLTHHVPKEAGRIRHQKGSLSEDIGHVFEILARIAFLVPGSIVA